MAFTYTFDKTKPTENDPTYDGDDEIRTVKLAVAERCGVEHYWSYTGNEVSDDTNVGQHLKVTFNAPLSSDPTTGTNKGALYTKDVSAKAELHFRDEDNDVIQLTNGGILYLGDDKNYTEEVQLTNTGNSLYGDIIACTAGGYLTLPTDSTDTTEGNIKYVTDGDTVQFKAASGWLTVLTTLTQAVTNCKIGSGAAGAVDLGFAPDLVIAWTDSSSDGVWMWSSMHSGAEKSLTSGVWDSSAEIITVATNSLTLGGLGGSTYYFIALELSAAAVSLA